MEPGIIYLSRVPPFMKPQKMRDILSKFGDIDHLFLRPEDEKFRKKRVKEGGSRKIRFIEGWVEFKEKKIAKAVASALNNTPMGGKKNSMYHDDLWSMKYLKNFCWSDLSGKIRYRNATAEKKARVGKAQAKRETEAYSQNVDNFKALESIISRKRKHQAAEEGAGADLSQAPSDEASSTSSKAWTYRQTTPAPKRRKISLGKVLSGGD